MSAPPSYPSSPITMAWHHSHVAPPPPSSLSTSIVLPRPDTALATVPIGGTSVRPRLGDLLPLPPRTRVASYGAGPGGPITPVSPMDVRGFLRTAAAVTAGPLLPGLHGGHTGGGGGAHWTVDGGMVTTVAAAAGSGHSSPVYPSPPAGFGGVAAAAAVSRL
ncbi:hypothetical protein BC828DRAFT_393530 [Blastocladiella britannica]|nr:hypothetical protein BC828DRAFT_393530 [Blastocladiella britannica]